MEWSVGARMNRRLRGGGDNHITSHHMGHMVPGKAHAIVGSKCHLLSPPPPPNSHELKNGFEIDRSLQGERPMGAWCLLGKFSVLPLVRLSHYVYCVLSSCMLSSWTSPVTVCPESQYIGDRLPPKGG